jgi:hypothetical protein
MYKNLMYICAFKKELFKMKSPLTTSLLQTNENALSTYKYIVCEVNSLDYKGDNI